MKAVNICHITTSYFGVMCQNTHYVNQNTHYVNVQISKIQMSHCALTNVMDLLKWALLHVTVLHGHYFRYYKEHSF